MNALDNQSIPLPARLTLADAALALANALVHEKATRAEQFAMQADGLCTMDEARSKCFAARQARKAAAAALTEAAQAAATHMIPEAEVSFDEDF